MNFPPRAGRVSGWATPSLRHAPRAKLQRTNPGSNPLSLRGILFKRSGPALNVAVTFIAIPYALSKKGARMTNMAGIPGDRICAFIERVEHIDEEIKR
jgi:hypothetical protein